jgi:4'-phosphopantetheinyl transferase
VLRCLSKAGLRTQIQADSLDPSASIFCFNIVKYFLIEARMPITVQTVGDALEDLKTAQIMSDEIHIWFADMDDQLADVQEYEAVLSPVEIFRAKRFHHLRDRNRYVVKHGILRILLSHYAGNHPRQIQIYSSSSGKPYLSNQSDNGSLQFSISDSDGLVLFAFGRHTMVGVDIERVGELPQMEEIVSSHFTNREKREFASCPGSECLYLFYRYWTRKEAVLKAAGEGLLRRLDCVNVTATGDGFKPWKVRIAGTALREFSIRDVECPKGYMAAVSAASHFSRIAVHQFHAGR